MGIMAFCGGLWWVCYLNLSNVAECWQLALSVEASSGGNDLVISLLQDLIFKDSTCTNWSLVDLDLSSGIIGLGFANKPLVFCH